MRLLDRLLELLYPPRCIFCRRFLEHGGPRGGPDVCPACRRILPWTSMCGRQKRRGLSVCVSPLYYEGPVKDCIHRYKFYGAAAYAAPCAALMEECVRASVAGQFDAVSWAPLSRRRLRSRGYDQARLLAGELARRLDMPLISTLEKVRNTAPQSLSGGAGKRFENISGAYRAVGDAAAGRRILLVDDVITTGATLSECAVALRQAGAKDVLGCTFARAHG